MRVLAEQSLHSVAASQRAIQVACWTEHQPFLVGSGMVAGLIVKSSLCVLTAWERSAARTIVRTAWENMIACADLFL